MAIDVLQAFLTKRMFDVGADDSRVTPLRETASDLAQVIKAAPQRTATITMIAIDGAIGGGEPLVGEIVKMLEKRWNSYAGAFTDQKLPTVARAIALHALSIAMSSDPIAAGVSLTARNMLPHLGSVCDHDLWSSIISDAELRMAQRAERDWALPSSANAAQATLSFEAVTALSPPGVPRDWLVQRFEAASGPSNVKGETLKEANQNYPNSGQPWAHAFAPAAAGAIVSAVNSSLKALVEGINENNNFESLRAAIAEYVNGTSQALVRTAVGLERRTALIWWKEALYSPAASISYRELTPSVAAALAAIDASAQTGPFAPRMAEAMVRETLLAIDPAQMAVKRSFVAHGEDLSAADGNVRSVLNSRYAVIHRETGRAPLGTMIGSDRKFTADGVASHLGLDPALEISSADLGVWLFRDLQAAAATVAPPIKRTRGPKSA